jgi:sRNA-binding protein
MTMERDDLERCVETLCEYYPKAFFLNARLRRPLKVGIAKDIKTDIAANPNSELRHYDVDQAVEWYCSHIGYYRVCSVAGTARVNLVGTNVGKITETEAREYDERAKEIFEQIEARKRPRSYIAPPAPAEIPVVKVLKVDTAMGNDELLASIEKHVATLKALVSLPDLHKELSRPVVLLLIDELKTLDARLSA